MQNSLNRRLLIFCVVLAVCGALSYLVHRKIAVSFSPSLRYTLFYLENRQGDKIRRDEYVLFTVDYPLVHDVMNALNIKTATKQVACAEGDLLVVSRKDYYCNGVYLGRAKDRSFKGELVDNFKYDGVVPAGRLFVMGHTIDSLDSRYFGFIKVGDVERIAHPLF